MRYDLLAQRIHDAALAVIGEDLFVHRMPAEVETGVLIRGPLDGIKIDHYLPGFYKTRLQIIVRGVNQQAGDVKAAAITALMTIRETEFQDAGVPKMHVQQMLPCALPIVYPRSEGEGIEWSLNFDVAYHIL